MDYELSRPAASEEEETDSSRLQGLENQVRAWLEESLMVAEERLGFVQVD